MQHYPTVTAVRQVSAEPIDVVAADDPTQQPGDITNPAAIQPVSPPCAAERPGALCRRRRVRRPAVQRSRGRAPMGTPDGGFLQDRTLGKAPVA